MSHEGLPVRVLVADDHPVFADGLARAIAERGDLELIGQACDGASALSLIRARRPDVALVDVRMPVADGLEVLDAVRAAGEETRIVLLSAHDELELVHRALSAGAAGYLSKESSRQVICDAAAAAARGELVVSASLQAALVRELATRSRGPAGVTLSERELDVLRLTATGLSAREIGGRLYISHMTVKTHLGHVYEKFGVVSDRAAAVAEGMRRGLLR